MIKVWGRVPRGPQGRPKDALEWPKDAPFDPSCSFFVSLVIFGHLLCTFGSILVHLGSILVASDTIWLPFWCHFLDFYQFLWIWGGFSIDCFSILASILIQNRFFGHPSSRITCRLPFAPPTKEKFWKTSGITSWSLYIEKKKICNINYLINNSINYSINYLINYLMQKRVGRKHL